MYKNNHSPNNWISSTTFRTYNWAVCSFQSDLTGILGQLLVSALPSSRMASINSSIFEVEQLLEALVSDNGDFRFYARYSNVFGYQTPF